MTDDLQEPVTDKLQLAEYLEQGCKPGTDWRVGVEYERFVCRGKDLCPAPYYGPGGIEALLRALEQFGWQPDAGTGPLIALSRGREHVSLEPAGQLEYASVPVADVHRIDADLAGHCREVAALAEDLGLALLGLGFEPLYPAQINNWIPQERFNIMRGYMPRVGGHGLDMMQRTASIQINLDYASEEDMVRKYRAALALQPVFIALAAGSPFASGRATGYQSYRSHVWQHTDSDRCGLPEIVFDEAMGFERYVDWVLDVPMYSIVRSGHHVDTAGESFRRFLAGELRPVPGETPTLDDWKYHLQTLCPEVRLKQLLELRGPDSGSPAMVSGLAALSVGLFYDDRSLAAVSDLIAHWNRETRQCLYCQAAERGLAAEFRGLNLGEIAALLLDLAAEGLGRRGIQNEKGNDERVYLEPLREIVETGQTLSAQMLECVDVGDAVSRFCRVS